MAKKKTEEESLELQITALLGNLHKKDPVAVVDSIANFLEFMDQECLESLNGALATELEKREEATT